MNHLSYADHTLSLGYVNSATTGFIHASRMQEAVSLALAAGRNLIISGPGGHAKSDFLNAVFGGIKGLDHYVKQISMGTTPEDLYGGIDLKQFNCPQNPALQYNVALSFLMHPVVVFEELFDGPPRALTTLKDTMTSGSLRNGHQQVPMQTRIFAAATNKSPQEIAKLGADVAALVERFAIQLEVNWPDYGENDFVSMFDAVENAANTTPPAFSWDDVEALQVQAKAVEFTKLVKLMYAAIVAELRQDKIILSPRTVMYGMDLIKAAASINGRDEAIPQDILAIQYLPGCQGATNRLRELINEMYDRFSIMETLEAFEQLLEDLAEKADAAADIDALSLVKSEAESLRQEIRSTAVHTSMATTRADLYSSCDGLIRRIDVRIQEIRRSLVPETDLDEVWKRYDEFRTQVRSTSALDNLVRLRQELVDYRDFVERLEVPDLQVNRRNGTLSGIERWINTCDLKIRQARSRSNNGWGNNGWNNQENGVEYTPQTMSSDYNVDGNGGYGRYESVQAWAGRTATRNIVDVDLNEYENG